MKQNRAPRFESRVEASESGELRGSLYIYDIIGWPWLEARLVVDALDSLKAAGARGLDVFFNSPGGDVYDSMAIYAAVERWDRGERVAMIDGLCASGASIIAMAADRVVSSVGGMFMIHNPWTRIAGESSDLRKRADWLDSIQGVMADIYSKASGTEVDEIKRMMNAETWMTAREALDKGFVDEISDDGTGQSRAPMSLLRQVAPDPLFDAYPAAALAVFNHNQLTEENEMNDEQRRALASELGLTTDASFETIMGSVRRSAALAAMAGAMLAELGLQPDASQQTAIGAIMRLKDPESRASAEELRALRDQMAERDARDAVEQARREGKITAEGTERWVWALKYARKDLAGFREWAASESPRVPLDEQRPRPADPVLERSDASRKFSGQLGLTDEDWAKYKDAV